MPLPTSTPPSRPPWQLVELFFALAAVLVAAGVAYWLRNEAINRRQWAEALAAIADLKVRQVDEWRQDLMRDGEVLAHDPGLARLAAQVARDPRNPTAEVELRSFLAAARTAWNLGSVFLLDAGGTNRMVVGGPDLTPGEQTVQVAATARATGEVLLSDLHRTIVAGPVHLDLVVPLPDPAGGASCAVLVEQVSAETYLFPLLRVWPTPARTAETLLVRAEGYHVLVLNAPRHLTGGPLEVRLPIGAAELPSAMAVRGVQGPVEGRDYRGVRVLAELRAIPGSTWRLVAKVDVAEAEADARRLAWEVALTVSLLVLLSGYLLLLAWRQQVSERERLRLAAELEQAGLQERLGALARLTHDVILLVDDDLRIVEANDRASTLYGYSAEEMLTLRVADIRAPEALTDLAAQLALTEAEGGAVYETVQRRKDGSTFPVEVSLRVVSRAGKRFYQGVIRDVSKRKRVEAELRASEERFRRLAETMPDGLLVGQDGRNVYANSAVARMLRAAGPEELLGLDLFAIIDPAQHEWARQHIQGALAGETQPPFEDVFIRLDGSRMPVEIAVSLATWQDRPALQVVARDITERKRTEEALRASQQIMEGIVNAIPVRVFWKDKSLVYLGCNAALARDAGFADPKDVIGKDDYQMGWRDQAELYRSDDRQVIESGCSKLLIEEPQTTPEGNTITLLTSKIPLRGPDGGISGVLGTYMDVTDRKRAEEALEQSRAQLFQAQKMETVGQLAGGIAHDFNNLLQAMLAGLAVVRTDGPDPGRLAELEEQARRGGALARQLLLFARRETSRPEPLDLNQVVNDAAGLVRRLLPGGVAFALELDPEELPVRADRGQLEQVVVNLAGNAADAMPEGGRLVLRTGGTGDSEVWLEVEDSGCGMPEEVRTRLFEPFFTTKKLGSGLGLAVVQGIVSQHQGRVEVESEVGRGSRFRVTLPRGAGLGRRPGVQPASTPLPARSQGERVLVVEDEGGVRVAIKAVLTKLGYRVVAVGSGEAALALPADEPFVVLLTDMVLPGISGAEVAAGLLERWPDLAVVVMSGYTEDDVIRRGALEGRVNFLQKPFDMAVLARELERVLASRRAAPRGRAEA